MLSLGPAARAWGRLPLVGAVAGTLVLTSTLDLSGRRTFASGEASHLMAAIGFGYLWLLAKPDGFASREDAVCPP